MSKKVLVTGGSGFLGANLAVKLVAKGYDVNLFYRAGEQHPFFKNLNANHFTGDINDEIALSKAMENCEVVFHTVGNMSFWKPDRPIQTKVNVDGTKTCINAAIKSGVKRFILTSTVNTIGIPKKGTIGDENTPFNWEKYDFNYAISKKKSEEIALKNNSQEFEVIAVNPGTFFGAGDINFNAGSYIKAVAQNQGYFASPGGTNCVPVKDVVNGHILAMEKGKPGETYILGGTNMKYKELFELIVKELKLLFNPVFEIPDFAVKLFGEANEFYHQLIQKKTQVVAESAKVGCLDLFYSSQKAERELGYQKSDFRIAIQEAITFYKEHKMI